MSVEVADGWWDTPDREEQRRRGLRWLAGLRWWAATGAMVGVLVTIALSWDFVSTPAIVVGLVTMVAVNGVLLWRTRQDSAVGRNELLLHAVVDLLMLTWLLAWSGGVQNPLSASYSFQVVLGALLNGRRGALFSSVASLVCMLILFGLDQAGWLPMPALRNPPALLWAIALVEGRARRARAVVQTDHGHQATSSSLGRRSARFDQSPAGILSICPLVSLSSSLALIMLSICSMI
jgi:hypothetical protein